MMQKWEYLHVRTSFSSEGNDKYSIHINGEEHPVLPEDMEAARLLNRFGEQGWELVQYDGGWIFKRPKVSATH